MVETLSQLALPNTTGVWPRSAQVCLTVPFKLKPTSSTNTSVWPAFHFFFQRRDPHIEPGPNRLFITFQRPFLWFLG